MGALRAAECAAFGMIGVGAIFDDYVSGRRTADADVAVVHAPEALGFRPLTEALVDVEATLARAQVQGSLDADEVWALDAAARAIHYKDRTWDAIMGALPVAPARRAAIAAAIGENRVSQKQADARALLDRIAAEVRRSDDGAAKITAPLQRTVFLDALEARIAPRRQADGGSGA